MSTSPDELDQALRDAFPVHEGQAELALADSDHPTSADDTGRRLTVRLLVYDEQGQIRDIKEQELPLFPAWAMDGDTPITVFVAGWALALREALAKIPISTMETLMPHDFSFPEVLELRTAHTPEDYRSAFLRKSRMGRWL